MAYVNAEKQGWDVEEDLHFEVIGDLEGALENLPQGNGDYFLWEKFTTKPYVDEGPFRHIGDCPTPWPCFVIAVRNEVLDRHPDEIRGILNTINSVTEGFKDIPGIAEMISERYNQQLEDVKQWLSLTSWSQENLSIGQLDAVQTKLQQLDLIENKMASDEILFRFNES